VVLLKRSALFTGLRSSTLDKHANISRYSESINRNRRYLWLCMSNTFLEKEDEIQMFILAPALRKRRPVSYCNCQRAHRQRSSQETVWPIYLRSINGLPGTYGRDMD